MQQGITRRSATDGISNGEDQTAEERTVCDTTTDKAGQGEHAVKDAVCGVGECEILGASCPEVTDGAEHAHCRETTGVLVNVVATGVGMGRLALRSRATVDRL